MKTPYLRVPSMALIAVMLSAPALAEDTNKMSTLADYRKIYEDSVERIERKCAVDVARIKKEYTNSLHLIMPALMKTADLDAVIAVRQEQARAASEKELPAKDPPGMPPEAIKILDASRKAIKDAKSEKTQSAIQLMVNYLNCLNTLAKDLLVRNEVKKVQEVKTEIKKVEFVLADTTSRVDTEQHPQAQDVCPKCGGKRVVVTECYYCKGTGKCAGCNGTGSVRKPGATEKSSTFTHSLCRGTGKCPRCKGAGSSQEPCPACRP